MSTTRLDKKRLAAFDIAEMHRCVRGGRRLQRISGTVHACAQVVELAVVLPAIENSTDTQTWRPPTRP